MRMIKILAAAIALAIAAAPGTAMAKQPRKVVKVVKVAAVLGTANLFVFGPLKNGVWNWGGTATAGYVVGSIGCAALSPILTVAFEKRELTTDEVLWSTATCFFPPLVLIPLLSR